MMEPSAQASPPGENVDAKAEFRKPSGEAANRKYRRRSPANGSSSSDDSPSRDRRYSPALRRESAKISETRHHKDDRRDSNRDSGRSMYDRGDVSYRYSERQSSRSSHSYNRHDDSRDTDRAYPKLSSRSDRDPRGNNYSDHSKRENEPRCRDNPRECEKYSRDKSDGSGHRSRDKDIETSYAEYKRYKDKDLSSDRDVSGRRHASSSVEDVGSRNRLKEDRDAREYKTDSRRESGDYRSNHSSAHEGSRSYRKDSTSRSDRSGHRLQESCRCDTKESDADNYRKSERKKDDDEERSKQRYLEESGEETEDRNSSPSKSRHSPAKKPKLFGMDSSYQKIDVSNSTAIADEKHPSSSKQAEESAGKVTSERAFVTDSDIDAAKLAAMKAAELVNKNLIGGTGCMSMEQKKKLLWGNKKNTTSEESAHRWDTTIFGDRDRQEKFNKLMSLSYLWPIVGCEGRHQGRAQARNERSREAENTAGLGKAIHRWAPTKRWSHCWVRSLRIYKHCWTWTCLSVFCSVLYYRISDLSSDLSLSRKYVIFYRWFPGLLIDLRTPCGLANVVLGRDC